MAIVKHKYGMVSKNSQVGFILEAVQKLCIKANNPFNLKHEQEKGVNCLLEGRGVFAVMPTGYSKRFIFQLFATAVMFAVMFVCSDVCNCSD